PRVLAGVDLAREAVGKEPLGLSCVDGEPIQRRVGLYRQGQGPPAQAPVRAPLQVATGANGAVPTGREDHLAVIGLDRTPPAVRSGEVLGDMQPLPALADISADKDLARRTREHS